MSAPASGSRSTRCATPSSPTGCAASPKSARISGPARIAVPAFPNSRRSFAMSAPPLPEPALLPIFLRLYGERVLVIGGGDAALAKIRLLLGCGAEIDVVAEAPCDELRLMANEGVLTLHRRAFEAADLAGARLCIVALDDPTEAAEAVHLASAAGVLVNAVDRPALSDFIVPAIVDRAPITVAIGTGGAAPALARDLRSRVEAAVPPGYAALAALCRDWRGRVAEALPGSDARRRFWNEVIDGPEATAALDGDRVEADR